jgi:hypothetical protein
MQMGDNIKMDVWEMFGGRGFDSSSSQQRPVVGSCVPSGCTGRGKLLDQLSELFASQGLCSMELSYSVPLDCAAAGDSLSQTFSHFSPEDGDSMLLRNVGFYQPTNGE